MHNSMYIRSHIEPQKRGKNGSERPVWGSYGKEENLENKIAKLIKIALK